MASSILYRFSVLALVTLLAACGGGGDDATITSEDPASYTPSQIIGKTAALVTITPSENCVITVVAEADVSFANSDHSEKVIDVSLGARLVQIESLYFGGDTRLTEAVPDGGTINKTVTARRDLSILAGRTYVFGFYFKNSRLATASPAISNTRITVTPKHTC